MSLKIVVLAKQVPDTRNVGKDAMTAEGTVNVTRQDLGEHALLFSLVKHASLLNNEAIVEFNVLRTKNNNVNDNSNERNECNNSK